MNQRGPQPELLRADGEGRGRQTRMPHRRGDRGEVSTSGRLCSGPAASRWGRGMWGGIWAPPGRPGGSFSKERGESGTVGGAEQRSRKDYTGWEGGGREGPLAAGCSGTAGRRVGVKHPCGTAPREDGEPGRCSFPAPVLWGEGAALALIEGPMTSDHRGDAWGLPSHA